MQLYGFSQRFLGSSDIGDQINPLVNVAVILILITPCTPEVVLVPISDVNV